MKVPDKWRCWTNGGAGQMKMPDNEGAGQTKVPDKYRCRTNGGVGQMKVPDKGRCRTKADTYSCRLRVENWA
jgi:hypothetical protein